MVVTVVESIGVGHGHDYVSGRSHGRPQEVHPWSQQLNICFITLIYPFFVYYIETIYHGRMVGKFVLQLLI